MKDALADNNEAVLFLEKQLERDAPNLDPETRRTLARMGASIAVKEAEKPENKAVSPEKTKEKKEKSVQLDFWEDGKRAAPNAVFRSALFPALHPTQKENRRFIKQENLFSTGGLEVIFTGEQFDQSDLDVYLELLNMARPYPLGQPVKFSAYGLLKALGLTTGGKDHARLHSVLIRLRGGTIDITDHKIRYFGGLIEGGIRDEISLNYEITINPKFADLFGFGMWATIDKEQGRP
ncbi:plasmid replication initiator TrfA [Methylovulum psychrotolerans]|uniref:TrfA family protein n=1 Tax=Methylovulum psychrotolerans TaxID=1704499 RepID=A0A2S5CFN6_9GAMM|nr:plasmid replication initiator TrfA [Methylovulum psychrotolerans]POZ49618.1 TrfA family protein [Methylovulum psychrotolerans]